MKIVSQSFCLINQTALNRPEVLTHLLEKFTMENQRVHVNPFRTLIFIIHHWLFNKLLIC